MLCTVDCHCEGIQQQENTEKIFLKRIYVVLRHLTKTKNSTGELYVPINDCVLPF